MLIYKEDQNTSTSEIKKDNILVPILSFLNCNMTKLNIKDIMWGRQHSLFPSQLGFSVTLNNIIYYKNLIWKMKLYMNWKKIDVHVSVIWVSTNVSVCRLYHRHKITGVEAHFWFSHPLIYWKISFYETIMNISKRKSWFSQPLDFPNRIFQLSCKIKLGDVFLIFSFTGPSGWIPGSVL